MIGYLWRKLLALSGSQQFGVCTDRPVCLGARWAGDAGGEEWKSRDEWNGEAVRSKNTSNLSTMTKCGDATDAITLIGLVAPLYDRFNE